MKYGNLTIGGIRRGKTNPTAKAYLMFFIASSITPITHIVKML